MILTWCESRFATYELEVDYSFPHTDHTVKCQQDLRQESFEGKTAVCNIVEKAITTSHISTDKPIR